MGTLREGSRGRRESGSEAEKNVELNKKKERKGKKRIYWSKGKKKSLLCKNQLFIQLVKMGLKSITSQYYCNFYAISDIQP